MTLIQTFRGTSSNGTDLTAVYAEQPAAGTAIALVLPGNDLPSLCIGASAFRSGNRARRL